MTFTEKALFIAVALLLAAVIAVGAQHVVPAPGCYVIAGFVGLVVGYYCDKLWRRWNP